MKIFVISEGYGDYADPNPKSKNKGGCGGFRPPKGHMDSQMYPECKGTDQDRDIVKKENKRKKKKKASNSKIVRIADNWKCEECGYKFDESQLNPPKLCPMCANENENRFVWDITDYISPEEMETLASEKIAELLAYRLKTAKKDSADDFDVNPWAVCHTTVDKDEDPEKYERCVQKVKKKHRKKKAFNLKKKTIAQTILEDLEDIDGSELAESKASLQNTINKNKKHIDRLEKILELQELPENDRSRIRATITDMIEKNKQLLSMLNATRATSPEAINEDFSVDEFSDPVNEEFRNDLWPERGMEKLEDEDSVLEDSRRNFKNLMRYENS